MTDLKDLYLTAIALVKNRVHVEESPKEHDSEFGFLIKELSVIELVRLLSISASLSAKILEDVQLSAEDFSPDAYLEAMIAGMVGVDLEED